MNHKKRGVAMKKTVGILMAIVMIASGGLAIAGPVELSLGQLDAVTAGTANEPNYDSQGNGGVVVGNASTATLEKIGEVSVDGSQQDATVLNLVNSAESGVANAVNVWDGRTDTAPAEVSVEVNQNNHIIQNGAHSASLRDYSRPEANVSETHHSEFSGTTDSSRNFTNDSMVDTRQQVDSGAFGGTTVDVKAGQGIAGTASNLTVHVDAGSVALDTDFMNHQEAAFHSDVSGAIDLPNIPLPPDGPDGDISLGTLDVSGETDITVSNEQTANVDLNWELPEVDLGFAGGICYVTAGTCSAKGSEDTTSSSTESGSEDSSKTVRSPVNIPNAEAEYIVVDDSQLSVTSDYRVALSGSAQQNVKALNLVNAAGSSVANAVNVSKASGFNLNQVNTVIQNR